MITGGYRMKKQGYLKPVYGIIFILCFTILCCLLMSCPPENGNGLDCIDFEDPPLGAEYYVLDIIEDSGSKVIVQSFQWGTGEWDSDGLAIIQNAGDADGSGQEIWTNNVNLLIDFCEPVEGVTLRFGNYGGNNNLKVNDDFENFVDFTTLPSSMGGATVNVTINATSPGQIGILELCGTISTLVIGGQELAIDDICPGPCK